MNILLIGSGAREYSIALALLKSPSLNKLYFAPGNGATHELGENIAISDFEALADFATTNDVALTIVGPEQPLVDGIVDIFTQKKLPIFGPSKAAARLEASKIYMKEFLTKYDIPTAKYIQSNSEDDLTTFITNHFSSEQSKTPVVIKADGLCAGKGVIITSDANEAKETINEMLSGAKFGEAGENIIIEEYLDGYELSLFAICDGSDYQLFPAAQDHKRLLDKDEGPNTGGMGAYAPTPMMNDALLEKVKKNIIEPTLLGMKKENNPYQGVLFAGLMVVGGEPILLEYNVRFGDPECEVLMPLLKSDAVELFQYATQGRIKDLQLEFYDKYCIGVVMASEHYPCQPSKPTPIRVQQIAPNTHISYAGVAQIQGELHASGGRVLVCVASGDTLQESRDEAYKLCTNTTFGGAQYRTDIAYRALGE